MTSFLAICALAFVAVVLVELPDKTLVATLVLSTKYRPRPVLLGVAGAFAVQCAVAVTAGGLIGLLPARVIEAVVAVLFGFGAVVLYRESRHVEPEEDADATRSIEPLPDLRVVAISFGVLFAAEWGDASQLATVALVARYHQPFAVGIGAFVALVGIAAVAVVAGKVILKRVPLALFHRAAAGLFGVLAVVAAVAAIRG